MPERNTSGTREDQEEQEQAQEERGLIKDRAQVASPAFRARTSARRNAAARILLLQLLRRSARAPLQVPRTGL